jgi:broad specificity phosphatase PhoE
MLWLVRHGESEGNAGRITSDYAAIPLTARGWAQAEQVAQACREPPARVVLSPYRRARQTAEPLLARFPGVPVVEAPVQEFTYLAASRCRNMDAPARLPLVEAYWARRAPGYCDGEGAESFVDLWGRAAGFLDGASHWQDLTVVFTHEQFIRALVVQVLFGAGPAGPVDMARFFALREGLPVPNGSIVRLELRGGRWWLGGIDRAHLGTVEPISSADGGRDPGFSELNGSEGGRRC